MDNCTLLRTVEWKNNKVINKAKTISLEDVLERCGGKINYMKCDCETSEYNFLMNKNLDETKAKLAATRATKINIKPSRLKLDGIS